MNIGTCRGRRAWRSGSALALGVVLALGASACSPATMDLATYAGAAESAADAYVSESQNLSARYQASVEDGVRAMLDEDMSDVDAAAAQLIVTETTNYLALIGDAMGRFEEQLSELAPPEELAAQHTAFLDAIASVHRAVPDAADAVGRAASIDDVAYALTASAFADGQPRWLATCTDLEAAVRALGRGLDLKCTAGGAQP